MQPSSAEREALQHGACFNPHPSRRTGATLSPTATKSAWAPRFNPHPSRRTGATASLFQCGAAVQLVSILTRPGGRVQPTPVSRSSYIAWSFNPHPSRRTGATTSFPSSVNSAFQVSILTRPGGRVQPSCSPAGVGRGVRFQSSPVPEDGCNLGVRAHRRASWSFNPHPSRRTGATGDSDHDVQSHSFNPHPSRRTGATQSPRRRGNVLGGVSILTRPGGRVQRYVRRVNLTEKEFQSSPVPEDGCNAVQPH